MSNDNQGAISGASEGGVVGQHPDSPSSPFLVGSATGNEVNTLQSRPVPIVCWKVEDIRFAFDSSFVTCNPDNSQDPLTNPDDPTSDPLAAPFSKTKGDIRDELILLASWITQYPGCPLSVFGHADPVGPAVDPDGYNKRLSGRRATAIYAILISATQPQKAASLWQAIAIDPNEHWGTSQSQVMQQLTGLPDGTSMNDLISAYLPKMIPPEYSALNIGPANFLAQGADSQGKGDYQGCSSFNPLLIFSQQREDSFAPGADDKDPVVYAARNLANAPNRRVMVLIFKKGSQVDPSKWPCPSASGDKSGCINRFWSDGETRRSTRLPAEDRTYAKTKDTFACRFYDRLMKDSPCYQERVPLVIRLINVDDELFKNKAYTLVVGGQTCQGTTSTDGIIRQMVPANATSGTLTLPKPNWTVSFNLQHLDDPAAADGAQARLNNLGFFASKALHDNVDDQTQRSLERFDIAHVPPIGFLTQADEDSGQVGASGDNAIDPKVSTTLKKVYGS